MSSFLKKIKKLGTDEPQETERKEEAKNEDPPIALRPSLTCPHRFGYLAKLPRNKQVPEECLTCRRLLECRNSSG